MQRTFPAAPCAQPSKPFQWLRRGVCPAAVLLALAVGGRASAQTVASYAFSQNTTQAYTPITGGTFVATASSSGDDLDANVYQNLPIGFTFRFAGTDYTSFTLSTNGFITLGATPPSDFDAPISSSTGYDAALAPFGADLVGNISAGNGAAGDLRYQTLGSGTAHTLVVQFSNFQPAGATSTLLNFQVRLDEAGSVVRFAYGAFPVEASFSTLAQVGLRGIYSGSSTPFNNRTTATDWTQTTPGAGRTATMTLSSTVKPPVGLEYAFTPPNSCPSPQQLNVNSITDTSAQLTFTPASPAPAGSYTLTIAPAPTGGSPQAVSASPYALTGLAAGTTYSVTLVSNCTGGVTSVPATLSFTTQASCTAPGGVAVTSVTTTTAQVSFTAGNGNTGYTATATPAAGGNGPVTVTGTASPLGITGLTPGIRYNVTVTGSCTGGATATSAPAVSFVTLAANDEPTTAQTLTVAATCTATYGATVGATTTTPNGYANPGSCGAAANPKDVWYQFTTAASGVASAGVRVAVAGTAAGTVRVFATAGGAAGPFSQVACSAGSGSNTQAPAFEATGLMPSTPYYISVAGFTSTDTQGTFSICLTHPTSCLAPTGVSAGSVTMNSASIAFAAGTGAATYTVTYTAAGGTAQTATGTTSPIALSGLTAATMYSVTVSSNCGGGATATSSPSINFTTSNLPCVAPSSVAANTVTSNSANIAFVSSGSGVSSFTVTYTPSGGAAQTATGTASPVALSGLTPATTYGVTVTSNCGGGQTATSSPAVSFTTSAAPLTDLTVTSGQSMTASGPYHNITVQSGGTLTLTGASSATGAVSIQGILITNCQVLSGAGSFTLAASGELQICDAAGITASGATGAVQLSTRTFSGEASYVYNGTVGQTTGSGLPARIRNLTVNNAAGLTLSQALGIRQLARLQSGNLNTSGQTFTLVSMAGAGTAVLDNTGGIVNGTGTMQRALDNTPAGGSGYRHYASPVSNAPASSLAAAGFAPVFTTSYNTSATASQTAPFPTVFGYDQSRIATAPSDYSSFDKGWFVPNGSDLLTPGRGYTAEVPNGVVVAFSGNFNNGAQPSGPLNRGTDPSAGYHLLGNPYPAPLDWNTVTAAQRPGMDAAMYVYQSAGPYTGTYRTYLTGISSTSPLIDAGSGYFVRVSAAAVPGAVNLTNANRVTTFGTQPAFGRGTASAVAIPLQLASATSADELLLTLSANAPASYDPSREAAKLLNPNGLNLAVATGTERLAVAALALPTTSEVVAPLYLSAPAAGSYTLQLPATTSLPTGLTLWLRDAVAGTQRPLQPGTALALALPAGTVAGRFAVVLRSTTVTANAAPLTAATVGLYPNPAPGRFTLQLPAVPGVATATLALRNALGQQLETRTLSLTAGGATTEFGNGQRLPSGVYVLRIEAGAASLTRRVVVE